MVELGSRWHDKSTLDTATRVRDIVEHLWSESAFIRDRAKRSISQFEGLSLNSLGPDAFKNAEGFAGEDYARLHLNVAREIAQGVVAKVAGRTKPKCQIVASGADWPTKRKGKKLERFVEAQLSQPQGRYRDGWALGLRAFQDAVTVVGRGTLKIFGDVDAERIAIERVLPWETLTDPAEVRSGTPPLNRFQRSTFDADLLIARYPSQRDAIWRAKGRGVEGTASSSERGAESVVAYEAWRLPINGKGGRHVICVDGALLESEEWSRNEFPFVDVYWTEQTLGDGGTSLCEEVASLNDELNYTVERMREKMRNGANLVGSYEEGSVDESHLKSNENAIWIPRKAGSAPPTWTQPGGFSEPDLQWATMHRQWAFESSGQSYADSTGQPEPGTKSGVAIRLRAAVKSERFSVQANAYEQMMAVDLPRHIIACARQIADVAPDFKARWTGAKFLQEIPWPEVDMPEDMYVLQPQAVGGLVNTPEDRVALGETLYNAGMIGKDGFMRVIQFKDVESEMERTNQQDALVERFIESWLDATPEALESGEFRYYAPIPFMNHAAAIVQVATSYMNALMDGAPEFNLEFFTRFMTECDKEIAKVEARKAQLAGNAGTQAITPVAAAPAVQTGMVS